MTQDLFKRVWWIPALGFAGLAVTGCTDTETVIQEVPVEVPVEVPRSVIKEPLPEGAAGFLGYNDDALTNPTCAECHAEIGAEWKETHHAEAWADLQNSGHAQAFCDGCHTVGDAGNATEGDGGWVATQDARYHDVQCEACHGPGEDHVRTGENGPLASITVRDTADTNGCAECHNGTHHPFVEEWSQSPHAELVPSEHAISTASCQGCHTAQGALARFGVTSNYVENSLDPADALPQVCVVCHDPHDPTYEHQTRFPVNTSDLDLHLCAQCHNRRSEPDPGSSHGLGPHSPETNMLRGEAGFFFPNMPVNPGEIIATHGSGANPEACTTCHVNSRTITDAATGDFLLNTTGHLFAPIPCVDAQGIPTSGDCELSTTARSFSACVDSGCHGSEDAAFSALTAAKTRIEALVADLNDVLAQVDPNGADPFDGVDPATGLIDATDGVLTTAEGAYFNGQLAIHPGGDVFPSTTHNPFLLETLLIVSIQEVEDTYGVMPGGGAPKVDLNARLDDVLRKAGVR